MATSHGLDQKPANLANLVSLLKRYGKAKALSDGRHVHLHIQRSGYDCTPFIGNCLVQMYGNCGSIEEAREAFDKILKPNLFSWTALIKAYGQNGSLQYARDTFDRMPHRDVVSWTAVISSFVKNGHAKEALVLFDQMRGEGIKPDKFTFVSALDACASLAALESGQEIHAAIINSGYGQDVVVGTALINLYGKCGRVCDARSIFGSMPHRDIVCWNVMIASFCQNARNMEALNLFNQIQLEGIKPTNTTLVCALDASASLAALEEGQAIHAAIVDGGYRHHVVVGTALVNMYGKCGSICNARNVFLRMPHRDVICWTAIIVAFAQTGHYQEALDFFHQMQFEGVKPDSIILVCAVDACASLAAVAVGQQVHAAIICTTYKQDVLLGNALVNMYIKCRAMHDARDVFYRMPFRDALSWDALLRAFTESGHFNEALDLFFQMHCEGVKPDNTTYVCALDVCATLAALERGQLIHTAIVESGCAEDIIVGTELVNMYSKCGTMCNARSVFNSMPSWDIVSWNAIITGFVQNEHGQEALDVFQKMQLTGVKPNKVTFACALDACALLTDIEGGQEIYGAMLDTVHTFDVIVGTALVNMYSKCGKLPDARKVFHCMPHQDVISWTAMIVASVQNGHYQGALNLFYGMQCEGMKPDSITFVCAIDACTGLAALKEGQEIHGAIVDTGFEENIVVGTALINMYGNCGSVNDAKSTFDRLPLWDTASWNAIIAVLAQNGHGMEALLLFHQMHLITIKPDITTFICILTACSHSGLVDDARHFFYSMSEEHGVGCTIDHYVCMIDLLGRAGQLDEAEELINALPGEKAAVAWRCLLGACRIHGDVERGEHAANHCFELDPKNDAPYVMLSNIYAVAG